MIHNAPHVLVVDDDERLRALIARYLNEHGFVVATAADAADARAKLASLAFDVIVLDLMMPGEHGLDFAVACRLERPTPILMLTAMGEPDDRIAGLERGADDYLVKPFEPRELLLRLHNILKRSPVPEPPPREVRLGDLVFDAERNELSRDGEPVRLTSIEADLLRVVAARAGTPVSREDLIDLTGTGGGDRAVDVQVARLRRKIEPDPREPRYLRTVRGKGYMLTPDRGEG